MSATSSSNTECTFLLITANVGSLFEDPEGLLKLWLDEFFKTISQKNPMFIALHCQEVGGKTYEISMKNVQQFVNYLVESETLQNYSNARVFLDEDFTCTKNFTALGSFYFIHEALKNVKIWNFQDRNFHPVLGKEIFSGNIEAVSFKEKAKFPQEFFPECKWSRKGFMRTRWFCNDTIYDLTNIHLFHDASNFIAMESFPSSYSTIRFNALQYVLDRFANDVYEKVPLFIFGDFNFRLDTKAVIQRITQNFAEVQMRNKNDGAIEKILYNDPQSDDKTVLTLEKKVFDLIDHDGIFLNEKNHDWLLDLDKEVKSFEDLLFECKISFPPSYPFTEETTSSSYMRTRCPAWCDRILMNKSAMDLIKSQCNSSENCVKYEMIGKNVPMGDHKPISLWFKLVSSAGKWRSGFALLPKRKRDDSLHDCDYENNNSDRSKPRLRTFSIPSISRPIKSHPKARRTASAVSSCKPIYHNQDWYHKTQELFRLFRESTCNLTKASSSRLTSHHSSSSEEWYSDLPVDLNNLNNVNLQNSNQSNTGKFGTSDYPMETELKSNYLDRPKKSKGHHSLEHRLSDVKESLELNDGQEDMNELNPDIANSKQPLDSDFSANGIESKSNLSSKKINTKSNSKVINNKRRESCPKFCSLL
ncbi:type I inositol 1,4,5-trisphosphate 5-phosphatase isoform X1 [Tetranychus urticae]|uniref:type I inositol 1,4,5-trisphosphate 5-phosphatase isoform X1 n=1 Tax=Tetranychus urticae TaxID=32264 RepID=UPI00077B9371|nr:type I inositol 1,4,5-trisphosphate 5-phosphatase isoform X1 [Tetranychus urticae]